MPSTESGGCSAEEIDQHTIAANTLKSSLEGMDDCQIYSPPPVARTVDQAECNIRTVKADISNEAAKDSGVSQDFPEPCRESLFSSIGDSIKEPGSVETDMSTKVTMPESSNEECELVQPSISSIENKDDLSVVSVGLLCEKTSEASNQGSEPVQLSSSNCVPLTDGDIIVAEENERLATLSLKDDDNQDPDDEPEEIDKEVQYKKLIELLTKSQFYTDFLLKKIKLDKSESIKKGGKRSKVITGTESRHEGSAADVRTRNAKRNAQQMMGVAADVIYNKKLKEDEGISHKTKRDDLNDSPTKNQHSEELATKTLPNGFVVPLGQPELLTGACLRDYQMEGLEWLKVLYENGVNGILADEMGLGKTIQVIALIAHLVEKNVRGPFLIIGPLSTLPNWLIEFERFTPDIPVVVYHGVKEVRSKVALEMSQKKVVNGRKIYPVVLTSYEYPLRDVRIFRKSKWSYIIIDEGHKIKNHQSMLSKALRTLVSANRLLLTGTPLHNNLSELWALLNFLLPEIFDDLDIFESWFHVEDLENDLGNQKVLEEEKKKSILSTMHKILSPFMLRRVKSEVNLNLPPKKELIVYAPMTPIQLDLYRAVLDYNIQKLTNKADEPVIINGAKRTCTLTAKRYVFKDLQFDKNGDIADFEVTDDKKSLVVKDPENKAYAIKVKMQNTGMMMRQIVNHPYLVQYPLEPNSEYCRIDEDIVRTSGKLQVLDAMLHKLKNRGHKVLLFSSFTILLDILEDYLSLRNFQYVRLDGSTSLLDRRDHIAEFNSNPNIFLFLISTRAGGLGINLASADTVILYDSDWNPQVDLQAQDRCHRIGQTRPVVVYRFVTAGTVDERIVVRSAAKRKLEKMIIQKGSFTMSRSELSNELDLKDLEKLLNSRDHHGVIHPNGYVFSDEELEELLDRSDILGGQTPSTTANKLEARHFKEYYGYTGISEVGKNQEVKNNSAEVVDDNNDYSKGCNSTLLRRHIKK